MPGTDEAPRSPGSGGPTCRIISVGTLVPRKGHDVLLRALARLFDLDWQLTIVGSPDRDPVHARTLAALAEELGIAHRVRFAGEATDEALEALWREADLFALATHWEGYGMAVAEALKRGLPVAVTAGGAAGIGDAGGGCRLPARRSHQSVEGAAPAHLRCALRRDIAEAAWQVGRSCQAGRRRRGNSPRPWPGDGALRRGLARAARTIRSCRTQCGVGAAPGRSASRAAAPARSGRRNRQPVPVPGADHRPQAGLDPDRRRCRIARRGIRPHRRMGAPARLRRHSAG